MGPKLTKNSPSRSISSIFQRASQDALKGGISGGIAGCAQVLSLMWLRTIVNYQYRYGGSFYEAAVSLYHEGGIGRFYQGILYALIQSPFARFGSVASNEAAKVITESFFSSKQAAELAPVIGSFFSGIWRFLLMPIDTCKTILQVEGPDGFHRLLSQVMKGDLSLLYLGSVATMLSTAAAHYPWFYTHNFLEKSLPKRPSSLCLTMLRTALIGFLSSVVSDSLTNSLRVLKTLKQSTGPTSLMSYWEILVWVWREQGLWGLAGRGLGSRILVNGLQSILFVLVWKYLASLPLFRPSLAASRPPDDDDDNIDDDESPNPTSSIPPSKSSSHVHRSTSRSSSSSTFAFSTTSEKLV